MPRQVLDTWCLSGRRTDANDENFNYLKRFMRESGCYCAHPSPKRERLG
jgi:hypothetical protein